MRCIYYFTFPLLDFEKVKRSKVVLSFSLVVTSEVTPKVF